jgi:hypothetical protein
MTSPCSFKTWVRAKSWPIFPAAPSPVTAASCSCARTISASGCRARWPVALPTCADQRFADHTLPQLLAQRLYGLALGYEDLNDHDRLRHDPLLAAACDKRDPLGADRLLPHHRGAALAGPATLNRLELSNHQKTRAHRLAHDPQKVEECLLQMGVRCLPKHAVEIVLNLEAMGHLLHGAQEGGHFNGYYGDYCYLPLYAFVDDVPLWVQLRTSDHGADHQIVPALEKMIAAIRRRCKKARIIVRGDSGFCTEEILAWCEGQREVYYCVGLGKTQAVMYG